jgi:transposase
MDAFIQHIEDPCLAAINVCLDPQKLSEIEYSLFYKWVTAKPKNVTQQKRIRDLWEVSKHSIGCDVTEAVQFEASLLVESLKRTKTLLAAVEQKLEKECVKFSDYRYLLSIPGFGPAIATMTLGAIGDPHRFENGRQVLKLAGLDLSASRSGQSSLYAKTRISKKGKAELRYALYHAAFTASSRHKLMKSWFQSKIEKRQNEKGIGMKTRIKLSAKLLIIAWTLMKKQEPFNPTYLQP